MKRIFTIAAVLFMTASVWAQSPEKMSYQAVVRNASDALVTSTAVGMQISILQGGATGTAVYVETQTPTSNANGLVSLEIGAGTVVSGSFSTIDWANDTYFIKTETDPTGGTAYTITGTSQLMSVPYALHAKTADSIVGGVSITETDPVFGVSIANGITALDTANWNNHIIDTDTQLDSTDIANLGYNAGGITSEVDGSVTNEIQTISRTGTTVTLSNGGGTFQDSVGVYTEPIYTIGLHPALGGYVFRISADGKHGLVAETQDQSISNDWYTAQNIISDPANHSTNGQKFMDWRMPTRFELNEMYSQRAAIGGFANFRYWSSTERDGSIAWAHDFPSGLQGFSLKTITDYVRAVRAF